MTTRNAQFGMLERQYGIWMPDVVGYYSELLAMDAQPTLVTTPSSGIPSYLANYIDPNIIEVLVAPNKAAKILGESKKGDWTIETATFPIVEATGEVSSYGDYSENGSAGANINFPQRQSYHYQTMTNWGERQQEMTALAKIDWAAQVNKSSVLVIDKFQNNSYFFGVAGLQNYGLLNDPGLSAPIAPGPKAYNSNSSGPWITNGVVTATANEIYTDIQSLFNEVVSQSDGIIEADAKMCLAMSPGSSVALTTTNSFNVNVYDLLKKNFPNIRFETAVQYANTSQGNLVQLVVEEVEGQPTGTCAFTEKLRAHRIIPRTSSFVQKKSAGTWGSIIWRPFAIGQLVGV